ncbi:hypothetical protein BP5796_01119 [Coleophoma crateriformis]|uniref:Uncharacterized protein n=1 Tax=Coleophoma crateriformis TaxID=565419 RepID=A0A3D8T9Y8_9HELO|nr:hypothetical protein BP5796_01119 [Coleophoma crateriformis]
MEPEIVRSAGAAGLDIADTQIDAIIRSHLPPTPHLLSVPTTQQYLPEFPYENKNTTAARLFEPWEVKPLQYMTLITHGDRGVGLARGNWEDEINALSPPQSQGLPSSATTPNPRKEPKVKLSISDYRKVRNGEMPMPKASVSPPPEKKRKLDANQERPSQTTTGPKSGSDTMRQRAPPDDRKNGVAVAQSHKPEHRLPGHGLNGTLPPKPPRPDPRPADKAASKTNGQVERLHNDLPRSKDNTPARPSPRPDSAQKAKEKTQASTSRPLGTASNIWDIKKKRPLETSGRDASQPEKRARIENGHTRTPSGSRNPTPHQVETPPEVKSSPFKPGHSRTTSNLSRVSPSQSQSQSRKPIGSKRLPETKSAQKSSTHKPVNTLPPLLSPLPLDIGDASTGDSGFEFLAAQHDHRPSAKSPRKQVGDRSKHDSPLSSPLSSPEKSHPRSIPPALSPFLPDVLEQELAKLQQKSAYTPVETRHEKARLPDAPGVARKTVKSKVGHPPKRDRNSGSGSKSRSNDDEESYIVKLRYKRSDSGIIKQLLALKSVPTKEFRRLEAQRLDAERRAREYGNEEEFDEEEEETVSRPSLAKKRPVDSSNQEPPKRKVPESLDVAKLSTPVTPAFRSPGLTGPSQKSLLATPKKGDAMKSALGGAVMRRIDSSDGHARTPQATSSSTPASAEKPRFTNGDTRPEYDKLGLRLKRKMDTILKTKEKPAAQNISDKDRKLGLCIGLECISAYMLNASASARFEQKSGRPRQPVQWEQVIALWEFLERSCRQFPVLHALAMSMGAVCREQVHEIYAETRNEKIYANTKLRFQLWNQSHLEHHHYAHIEGTKDPLGPWSLIDQVAKFAHAVLGGFAKQEGIEWRRDE